MPSLMEQAVVDADKLREAAMRNAENSILEKYSKIFNSLDSSRVGMKTIFFISI